MPRCPGTKRFGWSPPSPAAEVSINAWQGRERLENMRQWPTLLALANRIEGADAFAGLVLLGSFASGTADELSDLDVIAVAQPGSFEQAWAARAQLSHDSLVRWDLPRGSHSAGHNWLTRDLVKVDCTIIDPGAVEKPLASPYAICVGQPEIAARFPQVSIETVREHAEQIAAEQNAISTDPDSMPYGELIDWKIAEFKQAVRRAPRT
jgi:predicted nucleotidyltransferase